MELYVLLFKSKRPTEYLALIENNSISEIRGLGMDTSWSILARQYVGHNFKS